MKRTVLIYLLCAGLAVTATAQMPEMLDEEGRQKADAVAREALETFRLLVNRQNYEELGFESRNELGSATLGTPIEEFMIGLDELRAYEPDQRGLVAISPTRRLTYPVLVGDNLRSSLTVGRGEEGWAAMSFGAPSYSQLLSAARESLSKGDSRQATDCFEIRVPALNVSFVAKREGGGLVLTPLLDDSRFGFERGSALPLKRVLEALAPVAREHNGLPT